MLDSPYTRYPVYRESLDEIVGILHVRDLVRRRCTTRSIARVDLEELLRPATMVPETKDLAALLTEFRRTNQHMAIVIDEYGAVEGIVTLEDLLEEIVGEIEDEFDLPDETVERVDEDTIRIDGTFSIDDFNEEFDIELPIEDYHTIAGFVFGAARPRRRARRRGLARRRRVPRRLGRGAADRPPDGHVRLAPPSARARGTARARRRRLLTPAPPARKNFRSVLRFSHALSYFIEDRPVIFVRLLTKWYPTCESASPMAMAGSLEALRELNRLRVIDALRQRGTASRSEIARHTGLSRTTVTTLVNDLQAKGLVVEQPLARVAGTGAGPRRCFGSTLLPARSSGSTSTTVISGSRSPTSRRPFSRSSGRISTSTTRRRPRSTPPPSSSTSFSPRRESHAAGSSASAPRSRGRSRATAPSDRP